MYTDRATRAWFVALEKSLTREDQNTGSALLECPMRTAMHGKSRVLSAISVELKYLFYHSKQNSFRICGGSSVG